MKEIIIDDEFKDLLPPLDPETFRLLEENILEYGLREPVILWKQKGSDAGIIIDGYNRYKICTEHHIPLRTTEMEFDSREEVIIWMITTQIARRNLTPMQLSYFRGRHYTADKKSQRNNNLYVQKSTNGQNVPLYPGSTANRLSEQYNVSSKTIMRDAKLAEAINRIGATSTDVKRKILTGEVPLNKSKLEALRVASQQEVEAVVAKIADGTYEKKGSNNTAANISAAILPEMKQLNTVIKNFASNFNSLFQQMNTGAGDATELKPVLRSFINQLEDLYQNIK